jgi:hypothetical protein
MRWERPLRTVRVLTLMMSNSLNERTSSLESRLIRRVKPSRTRSAIADRRLWPFSVSSLVIVAAEVRRIGDEATMIRLHRSLLLARAGGAGKPGNG